MGKTIKESQVDHSNDEKKEFVTKTIKESRVDHTKDAEKEFSTKTIKERDKKYIKNSANGDNSESIKDVQNNKEDILVKTSNNDTEHNESQIQSDNCNMEINGELSVLQNNQNDYLPK